MNINLKRLASGIACAAVLSLYGCGGSSSGVAPVVTPPVVTTTSVAITVIDGAIQNATVCLDKNDNGSCDAGEPSGKTDAAGKVNLTVDTADVGKYPVIAVVGTDAIDADTGAVPVPFTLSAPADQVAVVSPLTTLVQQTVASTGVSTEAAAATIQAVTGISVSLFQDYTTVPAPTDGSISAATVARMVVVTTQQQTTAIASSVGSTTIEGATITQADLDMAVQKKLLELLPALVATLSDPAVLAAGTQAEKEAALLAAATALVTESGLNTTSVATAVAINNQTSPTSETLGAGFNLNNLNFTDTSNFFIRVNAASLAQNTPDANNNVRYVERRYRSNSGNLAKWGRGSDPWRGADLHWSGSAWVNCPINFENTSSVRDAMGNVVYNYCNNAEIGKSNRASFDIAGKTLASVITDVRAAGYTNLSIGDNSPDKLTTLLGTATFPAGSSLLYNSATVSTTAISYYPGSGNPVGVSNVVNQYTKAVSDGGVASTQGAGVGCNSTEFQNTNGTSSTTLESMISAMTGTPCEFTGGSFVYQNVTYTNPDPVNEAWGQSTVDIGKVGTAPVGSGTAPSFYTTNTKLRVAFKGTGTNPVTYYACKERFNNGSTRNCTPIGTGSYAIATLGDARVLTLNNLPAQSTPLNYTRVLVERGGLVYLGFQSKPGVFNSARLNTAAATALLTQLGLPPDDPSVPFALTDASYQGTWDFRDAANTGESGITLFINANGNVSCREGSTNITCSLTITNPATGAFTWTDSSNGSPVTSTVTGNLNFLTGGVSGTFSDTISTPSTGSVVGHRR